ncbi:MAG TPA: Smr/MutS family protein, partial [Candidatus Acidoferrales bacterium]|nr:Smr/MutS family protein [Candidatus Acidoferrales bacterium]
ESVIARAKSLLKPEAHEAADLIAYLHRSRDELDRMQRQMAAERRALEAERAKLRTEWVARQQQRIKELEGQFAEIHKRFEENVTRVVAAVQERELRASLEKSTRRKLQETRSEAREELNAAVVQTISESQADLGVRAEAAESVSAEQLQAGRRVRVRGFRKPVIFRRLDGSAAEIEAGPLRMKVALDEITGIETAGEPSKAPITGTIRSSTTVSTQPGAGSVSDEINVIGLTVEQATELVDKFLDEAALAHKPRVRIIHGHGTGALRRGLGEFLKGHALVERTATEHPDRGGAAITVVELRA